MYLSGVSRSFLMKNLNLAKIAQAWQYVVAFGSLLGGTALLLLGEQFKGLGVLAAGCIFLPIFDAPPWIKVFVSVLVITFL
jgi:hypothetical protein